MGNGAVCRANCWPSLGGVDCGCVVYICAIPRMDGVLGVCRTVVAPVLPHHVVCLVGIESPTTLARGLDWGVCDFGCLVVESLLRIICPDLCGNLGGVDDLA